MMKILISWMIKCSKYHKTFTVAPYYITFIVYITEPTIFYGWNEQMIWKVSLVFH